MYSSEDVIAAALNDVEWFIPEGSEGFRDANYYPPGMIYRVSRNGVSVWVTCHGEGAVRLRDGKEVSGWQAMRDLRDSSFAIRNNAWFEIDTSAPGYGIEVHKILDLAVNYADELMARLTR